MSAEEIDSLTPREREILILIAEGDSLPEIAQKLSRSLKTIESHRLSLGRKLGAHNRVELAKIAFTSGLVSLDGLDKLGVQDNAAIERQQFNWINLINASIRQGTGRKLLERFSNAASQLPGIDIATIYTTERNKDESGQELDSHVVVAVYDRGEMIKPTPSHGKHPPCQQLIDQGNDRVKQGGQGLLPGDRWLKEVGASSYLVVPLLNDEGKQVGGVGLIGRKPMDHLEAFEKLIDFYAPRLAGAIGVFREIEALRLENQRLLTDLGRSRDT